MNTSTEKKFFGHPHQLGTLFQVELWERFSFYSMQAILVIYLSHQWSEGGLAMPEALAVGIVGAWVVGVQMIGVDPGSFWSQMQGGVSFRADVLNGVIKSFVFALLCGFIALVVGHESDATPEGVARATTTTVVISSLAVLASDVLMTALMFGDL